MSNVIDFNKKKVEALMPDFFEILLIDDFREKGNPKTWVNPDMEHAFGYMTDEDFYDGPVYRFRMTHDIHVVAVMDQKFFDSLCNWQASFEQKEAEGQWLNSHSGDTDYWNREALQMMHEIVALNLSEDWWSPGGEQFCFSDFGKTIPTDIAVEMSSPDVTFHRHGDTWAWST